MHQGDYTSTPYYQFPHLPNPIPNPNPTTDPLPNPHASSAPPFSSGYTPYAPTYPEAPLSPNPTSYSFNSPSQPSPFESQLSYQPPSQLQPYYPPCDHHHAAPVYAPPSNPNPNPPYSAPAYGFDDYGTLNRTRSDSYGKQNDDFYGEGVFAYEGGKVEPYGSRGTAPKSSSTWSGFDDYGRAIGGTSSGTSKVVKAVPKVDVEEDAKSGVQKFRVKLLAESGGQSTMDVLCQISLDGIRMLDPNTSRTLRIYPLENITRCDKFDSSTFAFWSKSLVDVEPRRIRLQSNSYTTNTLLDTVTAATIQFKEMDGSRRPAESLRTNEQPTEKNRGFGDWMNLIKPANEEKDHWVPDEAVSKCTACGVDFGAFVRRVDLLFLLIMFSVLCAWVLMFDHLCFEQHHCRNCGDIFCDKCTRGRIALTADENAQPVRVCDRCMAEVTQRLSNAKESSSKPVLQSHEDLAKKLQEELERNRRISGSTFDGGGGRMKEVACPICTVHLQVQVPISGSDTIECGVCQHPFLVSAH
ncbi:WD repeat and FYVE domain-containing protein 3 [Spatholobus suberectus]|nr:WD repeat and FYVE domain-containing protein 3 [Spatholobus suberectus]